MTDQDKAERYDYLQEKRKRSKAAFSDVLDKYMDLQNEDASIPARDVVRDLQRLYDDLYLLR